MPQQFQVADRRGHSDFENLSEVRQLRMTWRSPFHKPIFLRRPTLSRIAAEYKHSRQTVEPATESESDLRFEIGTGTQVVSELVENVIQLGGGASFKRSTPM